MWRGLKEMEDIIQKVGPGSSVLGNRVSLIISSFLRVKSALPHLLHNTLVNVVKKAFYDTSCSV